MKQAVNIISVYEVFLLLYLSLCIPIEISAKIQIFLSVDPKRFSFSQVLFKPQNWILTYLLYFYARILNSSSPNIYPQPITHSCDSVLQFHPSFLIYLLHNQPEAASHYVSQMVSLLRFWYLKQSLYGL